jgi:hypothetical protein
MLISMQRTIPSEKGEARLITGADDNAWVRAVILPARPAGYSGGLYHDVPT